MGLSLLETLPQVSCATGQVLIEEGRPIQGIYFLQSGEVYEGGAVFGDMS